MHWCVDRPSGRTRRSRWRPRRSCWRPVARVSFGQRHRTRRRRPRMAWRWRFGPARPWPISSSASSTRPSCNSPATTPFLVSEAVRGEGAYLRDHAGNRFMLDEHELAELAPRDVVARGIQKQMVADGADHVFLDLRHLDGPKMRRRFPTIARELDSPRTRSRHRPDPGRAGRALFHGWRRRRTSRRDQPARLAGGRRGGLHGCPRRQSAGQQLAARRSRLRPESGNRVAHLARRRFRSDRNAITGSGAGWTIDRIWRRSGHRSSRP